MASPTDRELLSAWKSGDRQAGEALFDRHYHSVARFFGNKVGRGAEDLTHNTFVKLLEGADRFRGDSSFRTFLFGIARNLLYQQYDRNRRDGERHDFGTVSVAELAPGAGTLIAQKQEEVLLLQALRSLPLQLQELLELYYWESSKAADIAEWLGVPEGTVRTRLRRAKQLLEQELERLSGSSEQLEKTSSCLNDWANGLRAGPATSPTR